MAAAPSPARAATAVDGDRFFAEYSALNHFTETVICTTERGEIMRWPTRMGTRRTL